MAQPLCVWRIQTYRNTVAQLLSVWRHTNHRNTVAQPLSVWRHIQTTAILRHNHFPCGDTQTTAILWHNHFQCCHTYKLIKKYGVFTTITFLGELHGLFNGNVLAFFLRILHGRFHLPMKTPSIRANARPVGSPGRLIIRRPFDPMSFDRFRPRTGLANIFEGAFSNYR